MMLTAILDWGRSRFGRTREVWCIGCKERRKARIHAFVDVEGSRGRRIVGRCLVCDARTSTFVGA